MGLSLGKNHLTKTELCAAESTLNRLLPLLLAVLVVLPVVMSGCKGGRAGETQEDSEAVAVTVQTPSEGVVRRIIRFTGDISPDSEVRVMPTVPERIIKLYKEVGDWVDEGEVVARVRNDMLELGVAQSQASLESARINLRSARDDFSRVEDLFNSGAVSKAQLDGARTRVDAAASQVKALEAAVAQTRTTSRDTALTAPISGVVTARFLDEGNMGAPSVPIYSLMRIDPVRVRVSVNEADFALVQAGMEVEVTVPAHPGEVFPGKVERVSPVLDLQTRMGTVEMIIPNPTQRLRPGMFATAQVVVERKEGALLIPEAALVFDEGAIQQGNGSSHFRVFLVSDDDLAVSRRVVVGLREGAKVEVVSGLSPSDQVVVRGWQFVRDGLPLRVVNRNSGGEQQ